MTAQKLFISTLLLWLGSIAVVESACSAGNDNCCRIRAEASITGVINQHRSELSSLLDAGLEDWKKHLLLNLSSQWKESSDRHDLSEDETHEDSVISSCSELSRTDQTLLQPDDKGRPFWALCVQHHPQAGNDWLVILNRVDKRTNFQRNWVAYREGFGNLDYSFWLGLDNLHRLTSKYRHELLVEVVDYGGTSYYARYTRFAVGDEASQYSLDQLGSYSGTAGDGFRGLQGMKFSTYDDDNDRSTKNCALAYNGGWWFDGCMGGAHLTGKHNNTSKSGSILWQFSNKKWKSVNYARMMIKKLI